MNGAGFNPANANGLTDLTCDTNTGNTNSPVASSASYNFVAGDVGAWLYVVSGTNFFPGWYQIASVASNKATLSAAVGQAVQRDTTFNPNKYYANTVAGFASTGTPTGGTFLIDYSQQDTAQATATDYTAVGSSTTLTSATGGFTRMMVGNIFHQTTTGTGAFGIVGWYEIVSYTNTTTVTLDRTPNTGTASVACTGFVGGAGRLNGLEDTFFEMIQASNEVWIKNGTYSISNTVSVASTNSTNTSPSYITGFNSLRGDVCNGTNRPVLTFGASSCTLGGNVAIRNLIATTTAASGCSTGNSAAAFNCKFTNTSTTTTRIALTAGTDSVMGNCEAVSQNGTAVSMNTGSKMFGCYMHDSSIGYTNGGTRTVLVGCVFEACRSSAINLSSASGSYFVVGNTVYGREGQIGTGINFSGASAPINRIVNNILYGLTTGVAVSTAELKSNQGEYNCYYNNTANTSNFSVEPTALLVDPTFAGAAQITGSTATTSGSVLTQSGGDFSTVTDNVDFLHVLSGTGVTTGGYLITSHTSTTLTVNNALGTSSGGDVVYFVTTGHNFAIGTNLKAAATPSAIGTECTSYLDTGAVQRQEPAGGGGSGGSFTFTG